jgi:hypothetical protein
MDRQWALDIGNPSQAMGVGTNMGFGIGIMGPNRIGLEGER